MMSDELIKKARTFTAQHELADFYSAVAFSGYSHAIDKWNETLADFAAECVKDALALADAADNYCDRCGDIVQVNAIERAIRAERERADKLHAKLVEIERCYLESGTECSSCYDLFTIAVLAQEAK